MNDDVDEFEEVACKCKLEDRKPTVDDFKGTKLWNVARCLLESLCAGKKLLFLINPPYGTACNGESSRGASKAGIATQTKMQRIMQRDNIGAPSQQLYAQFLYRIHLLSILFPRAISLGIFAPPLYMCSKIFKTLYETCLKGRFRDGFLLQASQFADVQGKWGISFCFWQDVLVTPDIATNDTPIHTLNVYEVTGNGVIPVKDCPRKSISFANGNIAAFTKEIKVPETPTYTSFTMSSALKLSDGTCTLHEGNLGVLVSNATIVEKNDQSVCIISSKMKGHFATYEIFPQNFNRICVNFTARRLITGPYATWVNCKDEYMIPNIEHPDYKRFEADSIIYSLFNTASNQSSLRDIEYNSKKWNIKNEFFWLSSDTMLALARAASPMNKDVEQDVNLFTGERYVYTLLQQAEVQANLSDTAKAVLAAATKLVIDSFKYRQDFAFIHPEYHINTWDAGWYQIKGILKEYMPDELKQFSELYKQFGDELRPLVYELGFLYK